MTTAYQAAEILQGCFRFNDDGDVVGRDDGVIKKLSAVLGSDWASGNGWDDSTDAAEIYRHARSRFEFKFGKLPF